MSPLTRFRAWALGACGVLATMLRAPGAAADDASRIAVFEARAAGVSDAASAAVTRQQYATLARLGHTTVPDAEVARVSERLGPGTPPPRAVLQAVRDLHAARGVLATVGAENGRYRLTLLVANADGTGPFVGSELADAATLEPTTDRLVRSLVAPPPAAPAVGPAPVDPSEREGFRLAVQTEGAIGVGSRFYNHLLGGRLDYLFPGDFALGGYLGYANLKGKEGRSSNLLPYAQLEYRLHGSNASRFRLPLRFASGYLPENGPFLRLSAGISFPIGKTTRLGFDLLAPTVWIARNRTVYSLDFAAEVSFLP